MRKRETDPSSPIMLSIVVPCYNEEAVLLSTWECLARLRQRLVSSGKVSAQSEIVFVDDGSSDATWPLIQGLIREGAPVAGIKLTRNCGHQNALLAGLSEARGDAVVTIDADLQDDESSIESMVDAFNDGCEIVYGVRRRRDTDTFFKRGTARAFYRLMDCLGVRTVPDHADYRLLSRRAIRQLLQYDEVNLFLRGMVPLLGLRSCIVLYDRKPRMAGDSKYPLRKMLEFAIDGITSFSTSPLRAITVLGIVLSAACLAVAGWALFVRLTSPEAVPGWASTILPIFLLGGVQLFCFGVIGEYVGKIYLESKRRPRFFIEELNYARDIRSQSSLASRRAATALTRIALKKRSLHQDPSPTANSVGVNSALSHPIKTNDGLFESTPLRSRRNGQSGLRIRHG